MKQIYYVIQTLLRGRGSNIIKVISLGLGLTMSILLFARVAYEQSFDTCFRSVDDVYQVWSVFTVKGKKYPPQEQNCGPVAGAILENFPELVEAATSTCRWAAGAPLYNGAIRFDEPKLVADSLFFQTMGIEVLSGDPVKDLQQKDVIYLSERLARRMFGNENPVGKIVSYDREFDLTVKGTYASLPDNATVRPDAIISFPSVWSREMLNYSWDGGDSFPAYIRFKKGADKSVVNSRIDEMMSKYTGYAPGATDMNYTAYVAPLRDTYRGYSEVKRMTKIMLALGFAILFIAALNYVLISISSLSYRAKAIGVHKCNGACGGGIFGMFLLETGIILLLALLLMGLLMVNFRDFFEDTASAKLTSLLAPERIWVPLSVVAVLLLVGGVLPGRIFARIPVTQVFRQYTEGKKGWKRPLLFVQFAGVAFIGGLMCVVMAQYAFVMNKDMGYNPERITVGYYTGDPEQREAAYQFFKGLPYVEALSSANGTPIEGYSGSMIQDEAGHSLFSARSCYYMRQDYPALMGMTFKAGRMAREESECVVNEIFAEMMHWGDDVVGRTVHVEGYDFKVAGLLNDFQIGDFTQSKQPFLARYSPAFYGDIHLRLKEPFAENLQKLNRDVAEARFHQGSLEFEGYNRKMAVAYNPVRIFRNATLLAALAMFFVMLMGLIGYTTDEVRRRSKEIAIRKVNGAEASSILELLSRDVLVVALPAVVLGIVASAYVNGIWMDQFAERISMHWALYVLVTLANLVLIVGCVFWKSWRIANENPVESIKSE